MSLNYLKYSGITGEQEAGPTGPTGPIGPTGPLGPAGAAGNDATALFLSAYFNGPLYVVNGVTRQYVWKDATVSSVVLSAGAAPLGSSVTIRVRRNNLPVITYELPTGSVYTRITGTYFSVVPDDYLTIDITSVGSTYPGSDLTVQFIT